MVSTKPCRHKTAFPSRDAARQKLVEIRNDPQVALEHFRLNRKLPVRAYKCDSCGQWHLTSSPRREGSAG